MTTSTAIGTEWTVTAGQQFLVRLRNHLGTRPRGLRLEADDDRVLIRVADDVPALARLQVVNAAAELLGTHVRKDLGMRWVNGIYAHVPVTVLCHLNGEVVQ